VKRPMVLSIEQKAMEGDRDAGASKEEDKVVMDVLTDEVVFRLENYFGI